MNINISLNEIHIIMIDRYLNRLQRIDQLIRQERTGNADELANTIGISRRQVYNFLEGMKDMGLEITYNRKNRTYVYEKPYRIKISFEIEEMSHASMEEFVENGLELPKNFKNAI